MLRGFGLRGDGVFATPSYGLEFVFHNLICELGSSALVVFAHGQGFVLVSLSAPRLDPFKKLKRDFAPGDRDPDSQSVILCGLVLSHRAEFGFLSSWHGSPPYPL